MKLRLNAVSLIIYVIACILAGALLALLLPGCAALGRVAETFTLGAGHSWSHGEWDNSQRSFDEQGNAVWGTVQVGAALKSTDDEARHMRAIDEALAQQAKDAKEAARVEQIRDVVEDAQQDAPSDSWGVTEWSALIGAVVAAGIAAWQRKALAGHVRTISNKVTGKGPEEQ